MVEINFNSRELYFYLFVPGVKQVSLASILTQAEHPSQDSCRRYTVVGYIGQKYTLDKRVVTSEKGTTVRHASRHATQLIWNCH